MTVTGTRILLLSASLLVAAGLPGAALAQSGDLTELLNRIDRLERDISTMGRDLARTGAQPAPAAERAPAAPLPAGSENALARIDTRLTAIEEEVRVATGRAESLSFRIDELANRLDKLVADVDYRLSAAEKGGAGLPKMTAAPSPPGVERARPGGKPGTLGTISQTELEKRGIPLDAPAGDGKQNQKQDGKQGKAGGQVETAALAPAADSVLQGKTPKERYQYAFGLLRQARYPEAEEALRAFIRLHGDDALASNARYWLGETFYVRGDHAHAAETFFDAYQKDPKGAKAPDTLLKLGLSLASLDKKKEACATFAKLEGDFPDLGSSLKTKLTRAKKDNRCK